MLKKKNIFKQNCAMMTYVTNFDLGNLLGKRSLKINYSYIFKVKTKTH